MKNHIIENDLKIKKGEIYICEEDTKFLIINESDKKILFLILKKFKFNLNFKN